MVSFLLRAIYRTICIIDFILFTVLMYLLAWLPKFLTHKFYPILFHSWCRIFIRAMGVNLELCQQHAKKLPNKYILIGNHPSSFEDIGIPALFNVISLAKIELKSWFVVGKISEAAGTLYVERESRESRARSKENLMQAVLAGKNIALYPEGGCKGRRIFEKFHYGVFDISLKTGVPILPVFLHYECQDSFEWDNVHLLRNMWDIFTAQNKTVKYYVFDPFDPKQFNSVEEYTQYAHQFYLDCQKRFLE